MIRIQASGFGQFLAVHGLFRGAGVDVVAGGGNALAVPDDTDRALLRAAAAMGAAVHADLGDTDPPAGPVTEPPGSTDATSEPARKPRKTTRSKTTRE
jgi:hypothetical protein